MASPQNSVLEELYKYNPSSIIELFQLELSPLQSYYTSISPNVYRFHNGYNENYGTASPNIEWNGSKYTGIPIQMEGVQFSSSGEIPRPTLTVANHNLDFTQLNKAYANLVGAKVRRIRTLVKFLDSENFEIRNLQANTEDLSSVSWAKVNTGIAANAITAPNGTLTADKIYEANETSTTHYVQQIYLTASVGSPSNNLKFCASCHFKAGERIYAGIGIVDSNNVQNAVTFNLSNGTVSSVTQNAVLSYGISNVGNGWYRCWVVASGAAGVTANRPAVRLFIDNDFSAATFTYAGVSPTNANTVTTGLYAWGSQLEIMTNPTNTPSVYRAVGTTWSANPTADPNAKFPDDVYTIDRMAEEIPGQVTYELAPAWDVEGVQLPRRQVVANICPWVYKADPCNWAYSGAISATYTSGSAAAATSAMTSTISGTTLTVSAVTGTLRANMFLTGATSGTQIVSQLTGTTGGVGTYSVNKSQTATVTAATTVGTYTRVPVKSSTKIGSGALFSVTVATAGGVYSGIIVTNPGKNYSATAENLTIDGTYLGGVSVTNDLVVTVSAVNSNYYDQNDAIVATSAEDRCGKRLTSCKLRFGTRALPFGGFPSAGLYGKPI